MQKLQKREIRLNRQEFLHKVRDIAGEDAPALRQALKQLAVERQPPGASSAPALDLLPPTVDAEGSGAAAASGEAPADCSRLISRVSVMRARCSPVWVRTST